jgi:hypothetical protein
MKYSDPRPYADPSAAARHLMEIANAVEAVQGRILIEDQRAIFVSRQGGSVQEYGAGMDLAIANGWLVRHESETFVTDAGGH